MNESYTLCAFLFLKKKNNGSLFLIAAGTIFMLGSMFLSGFYVKNLPPGLTWLKYLVSANIFTINIFGIFLFKYLTFFF
jgi:hypothetical protein